MALKLLQPGSQPLSFDVLDADLATIKGGEVVTLKSVLATAATDLASYDSFDGYVNPAKRTVVTKTLASGKRPLMLADDGIAGYGTLFGTVVGGTVGQVVSGGTVLGPHSSYASGKLTCWDKPGLYAVSLDAVDTTTSTGLMPTNATLDAGAAVYATTAGLLTPASGSAFETVVVGRFVEFQTSGSLVTTQSALVTALNSPSGSVAATRGFSYAVIHFDPVN